MGIMSRLSNAIHKQHWSTAALDIAVVALGILMALAVDAWWDARNDRQAEQLLLARLHADFTTVKKDLKIVANDHELTREAALALLDLPSNQAVPQTSETDGAIALVFIAVRTFNPGTAAVSSYMAGEGTQLIRNKALLNKLLTWPALVEDLQEEELSMQKAASERWTPYLAAKANLGPIYSAFGEVHDDLPARLAQPMPRQALIADEMFFNHVMERYKWQQLALRDLVPVQAAVEDILSLLEHELRP
jgi:hypothetical protein